MKRKQLTLFVDEHESENIEKIRSAFNPVQYRLIKSHVTLCREDEIEKIDGVIENILKPGIKSISIQFSAVTRFSDGKGVMLPATVNNQPFKSLRNQILKGIIDEPGDHHPHITLMHPANATCTRQDFELIKKNKFPDHLTFNMISLIEQDNGAPWKVLRQFNLKEIQ